MSTTTAPALTRRQREPRLDPERVAQRRYTLGLLQRDLAQAAGLSPQLVCDIEAGRRGGNARTRAALAAALGVEIEELLAR